MLIATMEQPDQASTTMETSPSHTSSMASSTPQTLAEFLEEHINDAEPPLPSVTRPPTPLFPTYLFPEDLPPPSDDLPPAYTRITPPPPYATRPPLALPVNLYQFRPVQFLPVGLSTPTTNKLQPGKLLSSAEATLDLPRVATYRQVLFLLNALAKVHAGVPAPCSTRRYFHRVAVQRNSDGVRLALLDRELWPRVRARVEGGVWRLVLLFCVVERTWTGESVWRGWVREIREEAWFGKPKRRWTCLLEEIVRRSDRYGSTS